MFVAAARAAAKVDPIAEQLVPRALVAAMKAASFGLVEHLRIRTRTIDDVVVRDPPQLVILGAGLDARAWRLDALDKSVVYEIDHPATQAYKKRRIGDRRVRAREVVFVGVDFEKDDLDERMTSAGHDKTRASTWIWEGVTPYLTEEAMDATVSIVARRSSRGSLLAMTYGTPALGDVPRALRPFVRPAFQILGEPLRGLISTDGAQSMVRKHGFEVVRDQSIEELGERMSLPRAWRAIAERVLVAEMRA
jgi:methyltransferase (TIGR00027 family)